MYYIYEFYRYVCSGLFSSMLPSLFPSEAVKKGSTFFQIGIVFGIEDLTTLLFSNIFGNGWIGPKLCFIAGSILQSIAVFTFGFLGYFDSSSAVAFFTFACVLKVLVGLGK